MLIWIFQSHVKAGYNRLLTVHWCVLPLGGANYLCQVSTRSDAIICIQKKEMTVVGNKQNAFCNFWEVWSYVLDMNYHSKNLSRPEFSIFQKSSIRQLMSCPKITSWSKSQISTIVGIVEVTSYCFLRAYRLWNANDAAKRSFFNKNELKIFSRQVNKGP